MATDDRTAHRFPRFERAEDERRHRKQRLAAAYRVFGRLGFGEGSAGHITARDPERPDHFWVNPLGMSFRKIRVKDLLLVDDEGKVVGPSGRGSGAGGGDWPLNQAAFAIHSRIHAARPEVVAAAHAHSTYGKAWSSLRRPLDPLTQDACAFYEDHVVFDDYTGAVFEVDEGQRIADALGPHKAAILANHGLLTVGRSVDEAAWWFITMERSCQAQLLAEAAGSPTPIRPEHAALTATQVGGAKAGWFQFQPLWDWIVDEEPDLLDE
jgi:ribulose-5-phosphate 4-epimerase/fuculose-1-phosphate aldolase